jgi:organic hydroperoxide reductase OsmC/OhrA
MANQHSYKTVVRWTGNRGTGTSSYRDYGREHEVSAGDRPMLLGSSDPAFRGDASRWSPEDLLVVALSQCHMLAYLHLCAVNGVVVQSYSDEATGSMRTHDDTGEFTEVTLHPHVTVTETFMCEQAQQLHESAHAACFIARSVNFPVRHDPSVTVA